MYYLLKHQSLKD